jgi:hypothetical protein
MKSEVYDVEARRSFLQHVEVQNRLTNTVGVYWSFLQLRVSGTKGSAEGHGGGIWRPIQLSCFNITSAESSV